MSTAMNFGSKSFQPRPPDKGSFPLDHFGECKRFQEKFMKCLRENKFENALCRHESKDYLECRMERQATDGARTTGETGVWRLDGWKGRQTLNSHGRPLGGASGAEPWRCPVTLRSLGVAEKGAPECPRSTPVGGAHSREGLLLSLPDHLEGRFSPMSSVKCTCDASVTWEARLSGHSAASCNTGRL